MRHLGVLCLLAGAALSPACTCQPGEPALVLSANPRTIDDQGQAATLTVTATDAKGQPGTGTVLLRSEVGSLTDGETVALDAAGEATASFSCSAASQTGCAGRVQVTAEWTTGGQRLTTETRVQVGTLDGGAGGGAGGGAAGGAGGGSGGGAGGGSGGAGGGAAGGGGGSGGGGGRVIDFSGCDGGPVDVVSAVTLDGGRPPRNVVLHMATPRPLPAPVRLVFNGRGSWSLVGVSFGTYMSNASPKPDEVTLRWGFSTGTSLSMCLLVWGDGGAEPTVGCTNDGGAPVTSLSLASRIDLSSLGDGDCMDVFFPGTSATCNPDAGAPSFSSCDAG